MSTPHLTSPASADAASSVIERAIVELAQPTLADLTTALQQLLERAAGALGSSDAGVWTDVSAAAILGAPAWRPAGEAGFPGGRTRLPAPIMVNGRPWGIVGFERAASRPWTAEERIFSALAAARMSEAVERSRRLDAEGTLRRWRRRVEEVEHLSRMGSWEWDIATDEIHWTEELFRVYGYPPGAFRASYEGFMRLLPEEDRVQVDAAVQASLRTREPFDIEHRVLGPTGEYRHIVGHGQVITDDTGKVVRLVGTAQDVTELRRAEEELRAMQTRFRDLYHQYPESVQILATDGRTLQVNERYTRLYGAKLEALEGYNVLTDPQLEPIRDLLRRGVEGEIVSLPPLLYDARRNPGTTPEGEWPRWIQGSIFPLRNVDGSVRELVFVHDDVTARKRAEEALRQANEELECRVAERTSELAATNEALEDEVAEHEAAKEELLERTRELEGIFQALPDLYFRFDRDGRILDYRAGSGQGLLLPPERVLGHRLDAVLPPHVVDRIALGMEEVDRTGGLAIVEYTLPLEDEEHDYEARILPLDDGTRISVIRDDTVRKRAERALRDREEHFRKLIENTSDIITILDADGTVRYQSPALRRLLGYADEALNGRNVFELIHPQDHEATRASFRGVLANPGESRSATYRFRHQDGSWRVVESTGRTLRPDSIAEGVVVNSRDVTERQEAQEALRFHTTLLEAQNQAAIDGILVTHEGRVLSRNERFADLFRVPEELRDPERSAEMLRWTRTQAADPEAYRETVERLRADPEALGRDEVLLADGRVLDRYSAPVRSSDGEYYGRIWTFRDITDRKRAEEDLRVAMEEAERANRAKSEFLSRMSHELRTPMNSILGFAQLLGRAELLPQHAKSVQHILKAGRHLLNLINEVLEISRIEAGRQNFSLEPVRLGPVLHEAIALVRPLATQWGVQVEEGPWSNADLFVRADRQRLVQVLLNLLANAIKYNRPGGRVHLTCLADSGAARVSVRVHDTGRGIPIEQREELFTPFARLGAEQTDVEGTGLGLALSQRLSEAMGGALVLEESGTQGSTFRVELAGADDPVAGLEESAQAAAPAPDAAHSEATLLYVEDNLANLSLVETILLSRPTWRTVPALQGQLGVELAREHRPDLILIDLHLPDISGEEVLRRLRADERTAAIPVIVISADATASSVTRLQAAGADGYLTKPLDVDEFLATMDRFLEGDR